MSDTTPLSSEKSMSAAKTLDKKQEIFSIIKFGLVGILNTAIDWGVYSLVFYPFGLQNWFIGSLQAGLYASQVVGYSAGVINSYVINRKITFKTDGKFFGPQMFKFIVVSVISMLASLATLIVIRDLGISALIDSLNAQGRTTMRVLVEYGQKAIATFFSMLVNYLGNRLWTFRKR